MPRGKGRAWVWGGLEDGSPLNYSVNVPTACVRLASTDISLRGSFFKNITVVHTLFCILRSFFLQFLESVHEDKPTRNAERSEGTNSLTLADVRSFLRVMFLKQFQLLLIHREA